MQVLKINFAELQKKLNILYRYFVKLTKRNLAQSILEWWEFKFVQMRSPFSEGEKKITK